MTGPPRKWSGVDLMFSPYVPKGEVFVVGDFKFEVALGTMEASCEHPQMSLSPPGGDPYAYDYRSLTWRLRQEFAISSRKRVERDPMLNAPRTSPPARADLRGWLRDTWRLMKRSFGYHARLATDTLRYESAANPNSFVKITGLTS